MGMVTLRITGLSCKGCAQAVEKALRGVKGVSAASVDLAASQAQVSFDEAAEAGTDHLIEAVRQAGYGAEPCAAEG